ncbi:IS3 family transposase [Snodgrassella gandavensis]|uniref:IS3 family transposase n=1 Tax=Snodgrassella gandavensis TaxID=2946698 RepID=UPI0034DE7333
MSEVTFKSIKTEFVKGKKFVTTGKPQQALAVQAYWCNHKQLHSSLGYWLPAEFNQRLLFYSVV